jgi:hypothetical protein
VINLRRSHFLASLALAGALAGALLSQQGASAADVRPIAATTQQVGLDDTCTLPNGTAVTIANGTMNALGNCFGTFGTGFIGNGFIGNGFIGNGFIGNGIIGNGFIGTGFPFFNNRFGFNTLQPFPFNRGIPFLGYPYNTAYYPGVPVLPSYPTYQAPVITTPQVTQPALPAVQLPAPTNVKVQSTTANSITFTWDAAGQTSWLVSVPVLGPTPAATTVPSFTVPNAVAGLKYCITVMASSGNGTSPWSPLFCASM